MSSAIGQELIQRLAAGVRPFEAGESETLAIGDRFSDLLWRAKSGANAESLPITVSRGVDVQMDPDVLERLGPLVDRAQAEGASQALVMTDDGLLRLDVLRRRVEGVVDPALDGDVLTRFDTVLDARTVQGDPSELNGPLLLPDRGWSATSHESLLRALANSGTANQ